MTVLEDKLVLEPATQLLSQAQVITSLLSNFSGTKLILLCYRDSTVKRFHIVDTELQRYPWCHKVSTCYIALYVYNFSSESFILFRCRWQATVLASLHIDHFGSDLHPSPHCVRPCNLSRPFHLTETQGTGSKRRHRWSISWAFRLFRPLGVSR